MLPDPLFAQILIHQQELRDQAETHRRINSARKHSQPRRQRALRAMPMRWLLRLAPGGGVS
jgi:hypothetical protein